MVKKVIELRNNDFCQSAVLDHNNDLKALFG